MNPIGIYIKIAAALALVAALTAGYFGIRHKGVVAGRAEIQMLWDAQKAADVLAKEKAVNDRLAENDNLRAAYAARDKTRNEIHEQELTTVRRQLDASRNRRVPIAASFCGAAAAREGQAPSASGVEQAASAGGFLPDSFANDLRQLAADADSAVADARSVYKSVKDSGCYQ